MSSPVFFRPALEPSLADVVDWTGATPPEGADLGLRFARVAPLDLAGPGDLTFLDNPRYAPALAGTRAAACIVPARYAASVPPGTVALVAKEPYRAVAVVAGRLYPEALRPGSLFGTVGISPSSTVHPEARLEPGVKMKVEDVLSGEEGKEFAVDLKFRSMEDFDPDKIVLKPDPHGHPRKSSILRGIQGGDPVMAQTAGMRFKP